MVSLPSTSFFQSDSECPRGTRTYTGRERLAAIPGSHSEDKVKLERLKIPALKRVCAANAFMVSGSKGQLVERLLACRQHERLNLTRCPYVEHYCNDTKLNLDFEIQNEPTHVGCRHWYSNGRQCKFRKTWTPATKADVLCARARARLCDEDAQGDLASVGLSDL